MIEEPSEGEKHGSGSPDYSGSIDVYTSGSMKDTKKVYVCSNPECGYLSTDC